MTSPRYAVSMCILLLGKNIKCQKWNFPFWNLLFANFGWIIILEHCAKKTVQKCFNNISFCNFDWILTATWAEGWLVCCLEWNDLADTAETTKNWFKIRTLPIAKRQLQLQVVRLLYSPFLQPPTQPPNNPPQKSILTSNFYLKLNPIFNPNRTQTPTTISTSTSTKLELNTTSVSAYFTDNC